MVDGNGNPMFFWEGRWSPICGHWFWDNQNGATSFCRKLGYTSGDQSRSYARYDEDAIRIGRCRYGESLEACTGGCNERGVGDGCAACSVGNNVAITISCDGRVPSSSSCSGIPNTTAAKVLVIIFNYFIQHHLDTSNLK